MLSVIYNPAHARYDVYVNGAHRGIATTMADGIALGQCIARDDRPARPPRLVPAPTVARAYPELMEAEGALYCDMRLLATGADAVAPALAIYAALSGGPLPEREQALAYARARRIVQ